MKKEVLIERWTSDAGEREDHYFLKDGGKTYLFGVNPMYVGKSVVAELLKIAIEGLTK